ncbi:MAG: glycogen synthase GlgA [Tissierellaceae bacterium]|nr:glycogen synthase GlgA [Tissierellaceae bacterium]
MKVLYVSSEASPFIKTGGLADVAGSFPKALKQNGCDIRVVLPLYSSISHEYRLRMKNIGFFYVELGWRRQYAGVLSLEHEGVTFYFIDNEYYFKRYNIYGEIDDHERFIFFSKAATILPRYLFFKPDIVHANDWHTGLIPLYIKDFAKGDGFYKEIKSVFTIHNLKYQGVFSDFVLEDVAGLSREYFREDGLKFYDSINLMKAGIVYCDRLTTVSGSYAVEIKTDYFGERLDGILRSQEYKLSGIVNGIDYDIYNPLTDKNLVKNFDSNSLSNKVENKKELQRIYNLPVREDVPLLSMVTRLVAMKGLDLVRFILDELLQEDVQLVLLGTGDKEYENMFRYFQEKYPEKVASRIYFNEKESHLIYGGSDIFIMPSLAEPCGISQLIALRYGTIPVVREVGGLKDTVIPYNEYTGEGNGFSFANFNAHELLSTIKRALSLYQDKDKWNKLVNQAMEAKHDWDESSKEYLKLYSSLMVN